MTTESSGPWSPTYGTTTLSTFSPRSPSRTSSSSNSDTQRPYSGTESDDTNNHLRRVTLSPGPRSGASEESYDDDNSIDEVDAALNNLDEELDDTEQVLSTWSSNAPQTTSYGSYTGSPSYLSLPSLFSPRSTSPSSVALGGPRMRLSRITERTEESNSRPVSGVSSQGRRSAFAGGAQSGHGRSATDPTTSRDLPPPGRASQLIAAFETNSPRAGHTRSLSTPRPTSPYPSSSGSRPSSPTKTSGTGTPLSATQSTYPSSPYGPRSYTDSRQTGTVGTSTYTPTTYSTLTTTQQTTSVTQTGSTTPTNTIRRPQTSPRSPLASVRNIVNLWKERTPTRSGRKSPTSRDSVSPPPSQPDESGDGGLFGIRRSASARIREHRRTGSGDDGDATESVSASSAHPSIGIDLGELSRFVGGSSTETPLHLGTLYYLNVHAEPPYLWQRCQAILYRHTLLLAWLAPGSGRGLVQLDLINCSAVESALSLGHPRARDDIGAVAAREQDAREGRDLVETLVPFWMIYADGIERLACESLVERQRWVNRIWEAINQPAPGARPRSPTGSIRTILSIESQSSVSSHTSTGSRSTVYIPPISDVPDIEDLYASGSEAGSRRHGSSVNGSSRYESIAGSRSSVSFTHRPSLLSSFNTRTVDDTAISGGDYVYRSDPRVIGRGAGSITRRIGSLRRTGSTTDLGLEYTSGRSSSDYETPPSGSSSDQYVSAGSSGYESPRTTSYAYSAFTRSGTGTSRTPASAFTSTGYTGLTSAERQELTSAFSPRGTESASLLGDSHGSSGTYSYTYSSTYGTGSPYTSSLSYASSSSPRPLSRTREIRRRGAPTARSSSRSYSSGSYLGSSEEYSDKENQNDGSTSNGVTLTSSTDTPGPSSSDETGYDVCPSSDLSELTPHTVVYGSTFDSSRTPSARSVASSESEKVSEKEYATASSGSAGYATPRSPATSFASLPTIPSLYSTADEGSHTYRTASEPESTQYSTARVPSEIPYIPSELSTPKARSVDLEPEEKSTRGISIMPSISSPSSVTELEPEEVPLPPSASVSVTSPSVLSERALPLTPSLPISSLTPSTPRTVTSSDVPTPSSIELSTTSLPSTLSSPIVSTSRAASALPTATPSSLSTESSVTEYLGPPSSEPVSEEWGRESNASYESSLLQPSPSVFSMALPEPPDNSFETSFLRASSVTSGPGLETLLETPTSVSSDYVPSPYPSLSRVSTPRTVTSSDVPTPSSLVLSSEESSSLVRTPSSVSSSSLVTQSSIESTLLRSVTPESRELPSVPEEGSEPPTEPSLPSSAPPSEAGVVEPGSRTPRSLSTPSPSFNVSISTPRGDRPSIATSLETKTEISTISSSLDRFDRLVDEIRGYDQNRRDENRDLDTGLRSIGDELQNLSDVIRGLRPGVVTRTDEGVGESEVVRPTGPRHLTISEPSERGGSSLNRTPSSISTASFLSSHHSDDWLYERSDSPPPWSTERESSTISSSEPSSAPGVTSVSSSSASSPPSSPSASSSSLSTIVPRRLPQDPLPILNELRGHLTALWDGQLATNRMLDDLTARRPPDQDEVLRRLANLEDTLRGFGGPAPPPEESTASEDSRGLRPLDEEDLAAPRPLHPDMRLGDYLQRILASTETVPPSSRVVPPPPLQPFSYIPRDGGREERLSPPPRILSEPIPVHIPRPRVPRRARVPRQPETEPETVYTQPPGPPESHVQRDASARPQPQDEQRMYPAVPSAGPPPRPVLGDLYDERDTRSAPPEPHEPGRPWYRPRPPTSAPPLERLGDTGARPPPGRQYIPMPRGPNIVNMPPVFDAMMEILRENRLAQLATFDQQREMTRYLTNLNEWLERDVNDRHNEMRSILGRIDALRNEMRRRGQDMPYEGESSTESSGSPEGPPPFIPPQPGYPGYPQPVHQLPEGFIPFPQQPGRQGPVIPGRSPPPFIPPEGLRQAPYVINIPPQGPQGPPVVPPPLDGGFGPGMPMPQPAPFGPESFVPQDGQMPAPIVRMEESEPSSTPSSDGRSFRDSRRRPSRRDSRSPTQVPLPSSVTPQPVPPRVTSELEPGVARHPDLQQPFSQPGPATVVVQPPGQPMQGPPVVPGTMMPPGMVPSYPSYPPPPQVIGSGPPQPLIIQQSRSRSSSRSRSRSPRSRRERSRSPIIMRADSGRSRRSPQPQQPTYIQQPPAAPIQQPAPPVFLPSGAPSGAPIIIPHSRSSSRSRSRSPRMTEVHIPPTAGVPPGMPYMPTQQPQIVMERSPSRRTPVPAQQPIILPSGSGRSRSPERPVIIQPTDTGRSRRSDRSRRSRSPPVVQVVPTGGTQILPTVQPGYEGYEPSRRRRYSRSPEYSRSPTRPYRSSGSRRSRRGRDRSRSRTPSRSPSPRSSRRRPRDEEDERDRPRRYSEYEQDPARYPPSRYDGREPRGEAVGSRYDDGREPRGEGLPTVGSRYDDGREPRGEGLPSVVPGRGRTPTRAAPRSEAGYSDGGHPRAPSGGYMPRSPTPVQYEEGPPASRHPSTRTPRSGQRPTEYSETLSGRSVSPVPTRVPSHRRTPSGRYETPVTEPRFAEGAVPVRSPSARTGGARTAVPTEYAPDEGYVPTAPPEARPLPTQPGAPRVVRPVTPVHGLAPMDTDPERLARLADAEGRLAQVADAADAAEDRREAEFREHEEHRQNIFSDAEARRDRLAEGARDEMMRQLEAATTGPGLPPPGVVPEGALPSEGARPSMPHSEGAVPVPAPGGLGPSPPGDVASIMSSVTQDTVSRRIDDILDTVRQEREEFARERQAAEAERQRLRAEADFARGEVLDSRDARIRELEEEVNRLRGDLEDERRMKITEDAEKEEVQRRQFEEHAEGLRSQLSDITNLINDQRETIQAKKDASDERWEIQQQRHNQCDSHWQDMQELIASLRDQVAEESRKAEEARALAASQAGMDRIIEELQKQNQEQRELLEQLGESWRQDSARQHEATIEAVRSTAQEQVPFNVQGYLDEFSKALASEVRMLLGEVGKLREERRNLQHEIGYLLCTRAKYGPGGEFDPEWKPPSVVPPGPPGPPSGDAGPPPPEPPPPDVPQARPAWRNVYPRPSRKSRKKDTPPPPPAPAAQTPDPRAQIRSWATWQPDPSLRPTPPVVEPTLVVPGDRSPGLFGPRSRGSSLQEQT